MANLNICSVAYASKLGKRGLAGQQQSTDEALSRVAPHHQQPLILLLFLLSTVFSTKFECRKRDNHTVIAAIEVLLRVSPHLPLHWATSWRFDGKPTVYYCLGTDDTKCRQSESFTVSLIPQWEAVLNESSTSLAGKYLQWFPSRSGSLGSTFVAQVSWRRFVWRRSLAVLPFPQDWKVMLNTQVVTWDVFVLSILCWNDTALVPAANVIQVSMTVPQNCKIQSDPVQYGHKKIEKVSRERVMLSASHGGWKKVSFGASVLWL